MMTLRTRPTMARPILALNAAMAFAPVLTQAQDKFGARNGTITFFSSAPLEDITAVNHNAAGVLVPATGALEFSVLIKAFEFQKAKMQEHFNENYMESGKWPKAQFKGMLKPKPGEDLTTIGKHVVEVAGTLTIHGVEKPLSSTATLTVAPDGSIAANCVFNVRPEDHAIDIPAVVRDNIAKSVRVTVDITYRKL